MGQRNAGQGDINQKSLPNRVKPGTFVSKLCVDVSVSHNPEVFPKNFPKFSVEPLLKSFLFVRKKYVCLQPLSWMFF